MRQNSIHTITEAFRDKTLVITGGTGSFGSTVLKHFLTTELKSIRIISRDEKNKILCATYCNLSIQSMRERSSFMWVMLGM